MGSEDTLFGRSNLCEHLLFCIFLLDICLLKRTGILTHQVGAIIISKKYIRNIRRHYFNKKNFVIIFKTKRYVQKNVDMTKVFFSCASSAIEVSSFRSTI